MSLWIESHVELGSHKKLCQLCYLLKITDVQAVGHLHYLWWWTIQNRPDGDLAGLFPVDVARASHFRGNSYRYLEALQSAGFIESMRIKDWMDYAGTLLKARERKRIWKEKKEELERSKERSENVPNSVLPLPRPLPRPRPKDKDLKDRRDKPSTVGQVIEYFLTQNSTQEEGQHFWDYQTAKGWKIGREPMKDWKAACRYWIRNGFSKNLGKNLTKGQQQTQASYLRWKERMKNENNGSERLPIGNGPAPISLPAASV